jgi:pimeloyl-ACP methyl ester carboxylesterase
VNRRLVRRLLLLLTACLIGLILVWAAASVIAPPANRAVAPPTPPGRLVSLAASDGVAIAASYWPGATGHGPAILLLHGINADRAAERSFGWHEGRDAAAALRFLRSGAPERKVAVIGSSLGGAAALLGEGAPLGVDAMVLHAVYPDIRTAIANRIARFSFPAFASLAEPLLSYQSHLRYGIGPERIAPIEGIRRYKGEVLVIGGSEDRSTTAAETRALFNAAAARSKQLWLIPGADHAAATKLWNEEYRSRLLALLQRTLGDPQAAPAPRGAVSAAR